MPSRVGILSLFSANAISQIGNMVSFVAVPWFILQTTGSAAKTGLAVAAFGLGLVVPAMLGGPLVDRVGYKRTSVLSDVVCGLVIGAVPVLSLAGLLTFWELVVCVFLLASVNAQGETARFSLVPTLAQRADLAPERANSIDRAIGHLGQLIGPVLAGFLIQIVGAANALFADAGTFAVSAVVLALGLPAAASTAGPSMSDATRGYLPELLEGLRFIWSNTLILSMILLFMVTNSLDVPLVQVILPVYTRTYFGSAAKLGVLVGAFAVGAVIGTLAYGILARRLPRRVTFLSCYVLTPLVIYGALAAKLPFALIMLAGVLGGIIDGPINPLYQTLIQENTPAQMRGRVFGALSAIAQGGIAVGAAVIGIFVQGAGLIPTVVGMGIVYLVVTFGMSLNPALRRMGTAKNASAEGITPGGAAGSL